MALPDYLIGAGDIKISFLDPNGNPTTWRDVGECPVIEYGQTAEFVDNFKTGKTGPNLQDLHVLIRRTGALNLQLKEKTKDNLALIMHGTATSEVAGTVTVPVALPTGILVGDSVLIPGSHMGITALILKDNATTPVTLAAGTDYTFDGGSRLITFLNVAGFTQPFKVFSYAYTASSGVVLSNATPLPCAVIFDGINLAVAGKKIWTRFDNVTFAPSATYALKAGGAGGTANEVAMYEIPGVCQLKPGNVQSDGYGVMSTF
jgi:hypothetical protein